MPSIGFIYKEKLIIKHFGLILWIIIKNKYYILKMGVKTTQKKDKKESTEGFAGYVYGGVFRQGHVRYWTVDTVSNVESLEEWLGETFKPLYGNDVQARYVKLDEVDSVMAALEKEHNDAHLNDNLFEVKSNDASKWLKEVTGKNQVKTWNTRSNDAEEGDKADEKPSKGKTVTKDSKESKETKTEGKSSKMVTSSGKKSASKEKEESEDEASDEEASDDEVDESGSDGEPTDAESEEEEKTSKGKKDAKTTSKKDTKDTKESKSSKDTKSKEKEKVTVKAKQTESKSSGKSKSK
jgi:hypothetical protein